MHLINPMFIIILVCALYLLWDGAEKIRRPPLN